MHHTFIPGIEACRRGPILISAVIGGLLIDPHDWNVFQRLAGIGDGCVREIAPFEKTRPAHEDDPLITALLAGKRRARQCD